MTNKCFLETDDYAPMLHVCASVVGCDGEQDTCKDVYPDCYISSLVHQAKFTP